MTKEDILSFEGLIMEKLEFNVLLESPFRKEIYETGSI